MEDHEILQEILHEIKGMNQRMDGMDAQMNGMQSDMNQRFDAMNQRMDGMNQHMDKMDTRMDGMNQRMDKIDTHIDGMQTSIQTLTDDVTSVKADTVRIYTLEKKVDALNDGMRGVTERFAKQDEMDAKLDSLAIDVHALRETVSSHSAQLKAIK